MNKPDRPRCYIPSISLKAFLVLEKNILSVPLGFNGFNDNIYHEGNISKMPDFDAFSLIDIKKRNKRSHGKRKNGNFKRKHKSVLSLFDLKIILNSGRHQMLSILASLSVSSLR